MYSGNTKYSGISKIFRSLLALSTVLTMLIVDIDDIADIVGIVDIFDIVDTVNIDGNVDQTCKKRKKEHKRTLWLKKLAQKTRKFDTFRIRDKTAQLPLKVTFIL